GVTVQLVDETLGPFGAGVDLVAVLAAGLVVDELGGLVDTTVDLVAVLIKRIGELVLDLVEVHGAHIPSRWPVRAAGRETRRAREAFLPVHRWFRNENHRTSY